MHSPPRAFAEESSIRPRATHPGEPLRRRLDGARNDGGVNHSVGKTAVLLGAGASRDAGLPLTAELAEKIVDKANQPRRRSFDPAVPDFVRAINAVYGGMVGHSGTRGRNPLDAVNIETLISAVRLLKHRDDHEVAPFVAAWSPFVAQFGSTELPGQAVRDLANNIVNTAGAGLLGGSGHSNRKVADSVAAIAQAAVTPDLTKPFQDAETFILSSLHALLREPYDVTYLTPLTDLAGAQPGGLDVLTLNYDLTVEMIAEQSGTPIERGIGSWVPGAELEFPERDGTLNLIKMHGSLDWFRDRARTSQWDSLEPLRLAAKPQGSERADDLPWIVVGDRDKLGTDGPTLALNQAAREALARATHLVVVGYSFGDSHVNAMIRDWLTHNDERTMTILDKTWPRSGYVDSDADFRTALVAKYGRDRSRTERLRPRVLPIEGTAGDSLARALEERPAPRPADVLQVELVKTAPEPVLSVRWNGKDLQDATLTVLPPDLDADDLGIRLEPLFESDRGASLFSDYRSQGWATNETRSFRVIGHEPGERVMIRIAGSSLVGRLEEDRKLTLPGDPAQA